MNKYEVVLIINYVEEEQTNNVIERFQKIITDNGGTVDKVDNWGNRRLAYEIKDHNEGYYCFMEFTSPASTVKELDRVLKITEDILKHMIIRIEE